METYEICVAGLTRRLPIRRVGTEAAIAFLQLHGDIELCEAVARELAAAAATDCDVIAAPESKAVPLAHELARLVNKPYIVLRKSWKPYLSMAATTAISTFTTRTRQHLWLDPVDATAVEGRRVWLVDDVVTTGATMRASAALIEGAGGKITERLAVFREGDDADCQGLVHLGTLPIFAAPAATAATRSLAQGFHHNALDLQEPWRLVYTALSKHSFCYRVFVTKYVLDRRHVPLNPAMNFDFAFHGLSAKDVVITANNNLIRAAEEVWVFGPISDGVWAEVLIAERFGKPVRFHEFGKGAMIKEVPVEDCQFEPDVAPYIAHPGLGSAHMSTAAFSSVSPEATTGTDTSGR